MEDRGDLAMTGARLGTGIWEMQEARSDKNGIPVSKSKVFKV